MPIRTRRRHRRRSPSRFPTPPAWRATGRSSPRRSMRYDPRGCPILAVSDLTLTGPAAVTTAAPTITIQPTGGHGGRGPGGEFPRGHHRQPEPHLPVAEVRCGARRKNELRADLGQRRARRRHLGRTVGFRRVPRHGRRLPGDGHGHRRHHDVGHRGRHREQPGRDAFHRCAAGAANRVGRRHRGVFRRRDGQPRPGVSVAQGWRRSFRSDRGDVPARQRPGCRRRRIRGRRPQRRRCRDQLARVARGHDAGHGPGHQPPARRPDAGRGPGRGSLRRCDGCARNCVSMVKGQRGARGRHGRRARLVGGDGGRQQSLHRGRGQFRRECHVRRRGADRATEQLCGIVVRVPRDRRNLCAPGQRRQHGRAAGLRPRLAHRLRGPHRQRRWQRPVPVHRRRNPRRAGHRRGTGGGFRFPGSCPGGRRDDLRRHDGRRRRAERFPFGADAGPAYGRPRQRRGSDGDGGGFLRGQRRG